MFAVVWTLLAAVLALSFCLATTFFNLLYTARQKPVGSTLNPSYCTKLMWNIPKWCQSILDEASYIIFIIHRHRFEYSVFIQLHLTNTPFWMKVCCRTISSIHNKQSENRKQLSVFVIIKVAGMAESRARFTFTLHAKFLQLLASNRGHQGAQAVNMISLPQYWINLWYQTMQHKWSSVAVHGNTVQNERGLSRDRVEMQHNWNVAWDQVFCINNSDESGIS